MAAATVTTLAIPRAPVPANKQSHAGRGPHAAARGAHRLAARPSSVVAAGLALLDGGVLTAALAAAYGIRFRAGLPLLEPLPERLDFYSSIAFWAVPVWIGLFALYGLYDQHILFVGSGEFHRIASACTAGTFAVAAVSFLDAGDHVSRGWLLLTWTLSILVVVLSRSAVRLAVRTARRRGLLTEPTIVVGANEEARAIAEQLTADPACGARIFGFVDERCEPGVGVTAGLPVLGRRAELSQIVRRYGVRNLVVAPTALTRADLLALYREFGEDDTVEIHLSSGLFEILTTGVQVHELGAVPLITLRRARITGLNAALKKVLDVAGAAVGLLLSGPLLVVLAVLIKLDSPGPALHRRRVLGQGGKPFDAFKLRTMVANADSVLATDRALRSAFERNFKLPDDPRITRVGKWIRRLSVDELPQLLNVLRGEMSLVGPRMIAPDEAPRYGKWRLNLLTVKPGITGPWQVCGRSDLPYPDRVRLSMEYVRNYSLWLDLQILLRTVLVVLRGRGAY